MPPTIGWDENAPAGQDSLGQGDNEIRSLKSALRTGLDAEHVWPSGGGDAGVHRLGSARVQYGTQSLVSSTGTDGRLMQTSDSSRLFHIGSTGTSFIGGPTVISAGSYPGGAAPQRYVWVEEFGEGQVKSAATTVTIPNSGYSGKPYLWLTGNLDTVVATDTPVFFFVDRGVAYSATQFGVDNRDATNTRQSDASFFWRSLGSRVL